MCRADIKDCLVTELTDLSRNMMLSIDIVPVPTDEAVREVETRLLGVETNITNWQRRQNANNNFSAVIPYDMELQRREAKEFLDDLTTRDQRMMLCVLTMVLTAETQEQLDSDTETVLAICWTPYRPAQWCPTPSLWSCSIRQQRTGRSWQSS